MLASYTKTTTTTMERDNLPTTPKTPTASAWWALMEDQSYDEGKTATTSQPDTKCGTGTRWATSFWGMLIPNNPSDEFEGESYIREQSANPTSLPANETIALDEETTEKSKLRFDPDGQNAESFFQLFQINCSNLQTAAFSKMVEIEEELGDHIEKVESPCKLLSKPTDAVFDEYDDPSHEIDSECDDSGIIITEHRESPDILNELKEDIPFLRLRSTATISSKYKEILGSIASPSDVESAMKTTPQLSQRMSGVEAMYSSAKQPTARKFPGENSIDQLNDNAVQAQMKESYQQTRTTRTAKTENTTKASDVAPPETIVLNHKADIRDVSLSIVGTFSVDEIVKKVSTLTTAGEFSHYSSDVDMIHSNDSKMCIPPLLMQKLATLKNLKLSRSQSSAQSIKTTAFHTLHNDFNGESSENRQIDDLFTENGGKNHAYVAFFRRGLKATQSIRLYQHSIPEVFPILDNEVVVHVEASTVSQTDLQIRRGDFWGENSQRALNLPIVPGVAFAGIVYQTTQSGFRTGLNVGDRVIALVQVGANSRHLCIGSDQLVKVPEELNDPCSAACIPEIYLSAFQALHMGQKNGGRYRKTSLAGKHILVLGGTSVFGQALIEVAVAAGCSTVYATGSDKQFPAIYEAGGAPLGRDPRLWRSLLSQKVDILVGIDNSVGVSDFIEEYLKLLSRNGRMILVCSPDRDEPTTQVHDALIELFKINGRKLTLYNVFDMWERELKQCKRDLTHLLKLLGDGSIQPNILESITLNKVARAQDLMEGKKVNGFLICEPWIKGKRKREVISNQVYAESASKSASQEFVATVNTMNSDHCENSTELSGNDFIPIEPAVSYEIKT
jgi:NADPH:quinone reductase-like Zn-dependent oxidoreductase